MNKYAKNGQKEKPDRNIPYNSEGTNRQVIFHDDEDNLRFLETLKRYKVEAEIKTLGWCLMSNHVHLLVDSSFILRLFSDDRITAAKRFIEFNEMQNEYSFLDDSKVKRLTDEEAIVEMMKLITGIRITEIKSLSKTQRDDMVKKAKGIKGVSQRQIARILGIS